MASVSVDKRNGNLVLKAYAGIARQDPRRRKRYIRDVLPPGATEAEIARACDRLDERASWMKETGLALSLDDLVAWYLEELEGANRAPGTIKTYRSWYRRHVAPNHGKLPADEIRPFMIARDLRDAVAGAGGRGISPATANGARAVLCAAYARGQRERLVTANPAEAVEKLAVEDSDDARAFDEYELALLDGWMSGRAATWDDLCARRAAALALASGLRVGEICALRPGDVRRATSSLRVSGSVTEAGGTHRKGTKSGRKRTVSVDGATMDVLDRLMEQRAFILGTDHETVFCTSDGRARAPSTISRAFSDACDELGLPGRRFHELRHTHATMLLEQGVSVKTVSERLGHASEGFTLKVYGHVLPGRDRAAADGFGEAMRMIGGRHG